jgi:methylated-DNA-[protein]-cysteine S-methyltransferase
MTATAFHLFETAIGCCGIAWSERGIYAVLLPERDTAAIRARLHRRYPDATETSPPTEVARTIDDIVALLAGEPRDLSAARLDMERLPTFNRRVYEIARSIAPGTTLSYGEIAKQLGEPQEARAVGQALGRNPFPIIVPCHRVLAAGGKIGGFSAPGSIATKRKMLAIEARHAPQRDDAPRLFP